MIVSNFPLCLSDFRKEVTSFSSNRKPDLDLLIHLIMVIFFLHHLLELDDAFRRMMSSFEGKYFVFDEIFIKNAIGLLGEVCPWFGTISVRFWHDIINFIGSKIQNKTFFIKNALV